MTEELRKRFHTQLDEVRHRIVAMGGLVDEAINRGTQAFLEGDLDRAQTLIEDDDILDTMALETEELCYSLLALQQPMASDLRAVVTALWMTSEIERSGDLMSNIAKATRRIYGTALSPDLRVLLVQMSEEATRLFRLAIDSYASSEAGLAAALDDIDDRLDELNNQTVKAVFECHNAGEFGVQPAVQLALVCRYYERIGDHAVNIGERVRYMVDGWTPEHVGAARLSMRQELYGRMRAEVGDIDIEMGRVLQEDESGEGTSSQE
jgi:phosphate transport system protein